MWPHLSAAGLWLPCSHSRSRQMVQVLPASPSPPAAGSAAVSEAAISAAAASVSAAASVGNGAAAAASAAALAGKAGRAGRKLHPVAKQDVGQHCMHDSHLLPAGITQLLTCRSSSAAGCLRPCAVAVRWTCQRLRPYHIMLDDMAIHIQASIIAAGGRCCCGLCAHQVAVWAALHPRLPQLLPPHLTRL